MREDAFSFGKNIVLAQQCTEDIEHFHNKKTTLQRNNLLLVLALEKSDILRHNYANYSNHPSDLNSSKALKNEIDQLCPDLIPSAKRLCEEKYVKKCEESISKFQVKGSIAAIKNILRTICD